MGLTVFRPYPRRLERLTVSRCHYKGSSLLLSLLKTLKFWSGWVLNPWTRAQQTSTLPIIIELTRRQFVTWVYRMGEKFSRKCVWKISKTGELLCVGKQKMITWGRSNNGNHSGSQHIRSFQTTFFLAHASLYQTFIALWSWPAPYKWSQEQKLNGIFHRWDKLRPAVGQQFLKKNYWYCSDCHALLRDIILGH